MPVPQSFSSEQYTSDNAGYAVVGHGPQHCGVHSSNAVIDSCTVASGAVIEPVLLF